MQLPKGLYPQAENCCSKIFSQEGEVFSASMLTLCSCGLRQQRKQSRYSLDNIWKEVVLTRQRTHMLSARRIYHEPRQHAPVSLKKAKGAWHHEHGESVLAQDSHQGHHSRIGLHIWHCLLRRWLSVKCPTSLKILYFWNSDGFTEVPVKIAIYLQVGMIGSKRPVSGWFAI